jgi:hypothetical protein
VTYRATVLSLALAALTPIASKAQFTTFIAPARPSADSAKAATVAVQRARSDSTAQVSITNMKAWVDSAAGVAPPATASESLQVATTTNATSPTRTTGSATTSFSNGAVAPATASHLPMLALLGLASLSVGIVLVAGRKRA